MRTRKLIKFGVIPLAILILIISGAWLFARSGGDVAFEGNISSRDAAEINAAVVRMRQRVIMPDFSWRSICGLPAKIKWYREYRVDLIKGDASGTHAMVFLVRNGNANPTGGNITPPRLFGCGAVKLREGWKLEIRPE